MGHLIWRKPPDPKARDRALAGMTPEERVVTHAAAVATGEARVRLTDRRLLIIFVGLVAVVWWLLHNQQTNFDSFKNGQQATNDRQRHNCQQTQAAFDLVNGYFNGQEYIIRHRTDLSAAVKEAGINNIERNKLHALDCS